MNPAVCVAAAAVAFLSAAAYAQQAPAPPEKQFVDARGSVKPVPLPPGGPTPRMADGKPDLSGVFFPGPTGRAIGVEYQDNEELKSEEKIAKRDRNRWELDPASSDDWDDR